MSEPYSAIKITDSIYWVGAIDWSLRDFHGYATDRGTTYNAYLVLGDRPALIDTVRRPFCDEMFSRIASVMEPKDIRYIISNHSEMDHSGCLPQAAERIKPEKIFCSAKAVAVLQAHYHGKFEATPVEEGGNISLGNKTLRFLETRMLHWPESMFTYLVEDQVLFSQDGFGMHLASSERFDDELDPTVLESEAAKYFANILFPFAPMVSAALAKTAQVPIKMIAPDHGPVWRKDVEKIIGLYSLWAARKPTLKAVIIYDTMWNSTQRMAKAVEDGLVAEGISVKTLRLRENHRSNIAAELIDASAILVGSPTLNNNLFPTVADILCYLKGLRPKNLIGAAFGSYGWGGEAVTLIKEALVSMRVEMAAEPIKVPFVPDNEALVQCQAMGKQVAAKLKEMVAAAPSE